MQNLNNSATTDNITIGRFAKNYNGSAIYCNGVRANNTILQQGFGKTALPKFNNCNYGIFAEGMNIDSKHNNMTNMECGYRITTSAVRNIDIRTNAIDAQYDGIQLMFNDGAASNIIYDNDIAFGKSLNGTKKNAAIRINENGLTNPHSKIRSNNITFPANAYYANYGIFNQGATSYEIAENTFTLWNNVYNRYGLKIDGCLKNNISCNHITGGGQYSNTFGTILKDQAAISTISGDGHTFGCNDVNATENGIHVLSDFPFLKINGNKFTDHTFAFHYGHYALTPDVDYEGNIWNNQMAMTNGKLAINENPNYNVSIGPWFDANQNMLNAYPTITEQQPQGWFKPNFLKNNFDCNDPVPGTNYLTYCEQYPTNCGNCKTNIDVDIANGNIVNGAYTAATLWRMQRALYNKVDDNPALKSNSAINQFFNDKQSSILPELKAIDDEKENYFANDAVATSALVNTQLQIDSIYTLLQVAVNNLNTALDSNDQTAITNTIAQLQALQNSAYLLYTDMNNTAIADDSVRNAKADNIENDVVALNAVEEIETNEQQVEQIYLSTVARGIYGFTLNQKTILNDIAQQCPLEGGIAVIKARALRYMYDDSTTYNDRELCNDAGYVLRQNNNQNPIVGQEPLITVSLYPNPANNSVTIIYNYKVDCNATLIFTDGLGQIVQSIILPYGKHQYEMSTIDMPGGVYQYQLKCDKAALDRGKLIIVH